MNNSSKIDPEAATIDDIPLPAVQLVTVLPPDADRRIRALVETLPDVLQCDLSVTRLAEAANLSSSRLRALFKEAMGVPPVQHVKALRMEEAGRLLRTECLTVKQVMDKVGLNDYSDFLRDFKRVYHLTPSQYRNDYSRNGAVRVGIYQRLTTHNRLGQLTPLLTLG